MSVFFINSFLGAADGDFESIATVSVGSGGASSIEFTSIPSGFQHLQVRWVNRASSNDVTLQTLLRINGDTTTANYRSHRMWGNGSTVSADSQSGVAGIYIERQTGALASASIFGVGIIDILDYASTTNNKTVRTIGACDTNGDGQVSMNSGLYISTSAVTSLRLAFTNGANFVQHSTAALYGLRAP